MDDKKIAFITCVNDEIKYAECRFYLDQLNIPADYKMDVISIREAPSMAAGYNAAMRDSDAKYKIYLHQDVFIKNSSFLLDIVKVFSSNEWIGMLGMIGKRTEGETALEMMKWDTGSIIYDYQIMEWRTEKKGFTEASVIDGLLIATQYDIPWREDVFDGWDFYDFSQCMEFKKKGYKIVVPQQNTPWCCHDAVCSKLTEYFDYYERYLQEYAEETGKCTISNEEALTNKFNKEYAQKIILLRGEIEGLFNTEKREGLRILFQKSELLENINCLREYRSIVHIDEIEEMHRSDLRFWMPGMSAAELLAKFRILKYALKRIEYGVDDVEKIEIWRKYSGYAVKELCDHHVTDGKIIYRKLGLIK